MTKTVIDRMFDDNNEILSYLERSGEISYGISVDDYFRKSFLLACASYFETILVEKLTDFFAHHVNEAEVIVHFIRNKAISRQYHTYFKWEAKNANTFFGLFGEEFKKFCEQDTKSDPNFDKAIVAFLELGNERNQLVHQNFAAYTLSKTSKEIYELYQSATYFVDKFPEKLFSYTKSKSPQAIRNSSEQFPQRRESTPSSSSDQSAP